MNNKYGGKGGSGQSFGNKVKSYLKEDIYAFYRFFSGGAILELKDFMGDTDIDTTAPLRLCPAGKRIDLSYIGKEHYVDDFMGLTTEKMGRTFCFPPLRILSSFFQF